MLATPTRLIEIRALARITRASQGRGHLGVRSGRPTPHSALCDGFRGRPLIRISDKLVGLLDLALDQAAAQRGAGTCAPCPASINRERRTAFLSGDRSASRERTARRSAAPDARHRVSPVPMTLVYHYSVLDNSKMYPSELETNCG